MITPRADRRAALDSGLGGSVARGGRYIHALDGSAHVAMRQGDDDGEPEDDHNEYGDDEGRRLSILAQPHSLEFFPTPP